jgi:uncharacterized protein YidB (DUF937 family)
MSGFFGQMLQGVLGGGQQGQASVISTIVQQVLSVQEGDKQGIPAIIAKFQNAGLDKYVQSWIGTGANAPVSPEQVGSVFSLQQILSWAQQIGVSPETLQNLLAQGLPQVIDHLSPQGQMPDQPPQANDLASLIGRLFGGGTAPSRPA